MRVTRVQNQKAWHMGRMGCEMWESMGVRAQSFSNLWEEYRAGKKPRAGKEASGGKKASGGKEASGGKKGLGKKGARRHRAHGGLPYGIGESGHEGAERRRPREIPHVLALGGRVLEGRERHVETRETVP